MVPPDVLKNKKHPPIYRKLRKCYIHVQYRADKLQTMRYAQNTNSRAHNNLHVTEYLCFLVF